MTECGAVMRNGRICGRRSEHPGRHKSVEALNNQRAFVAAWQSENRQARTQYVSAWTAANPSKHAVSQLRGKLRPYGLTIEDYEALLVAQDGRCYICQRRPRQRKRLCVDHNHRTGEVRGLLCDYCNSTLGFMHENVQWFERAASYLVDPPSRKVFDSPRRHIKAPPVRDPDKAKGEQ